MPCLVHFFLSILEKRTYNGLPDFMTKVAQEELSKLDTSITECNILYLPQVTRVTYYTPVKTQRCS